MFRQLDIEYEPNQLSRLPTSHPRSHHKLVRHFFISLHPANISDALRNLSYLPMEQTSDLPICLSPQSMSDMLDDEELAPLKFSQRDLRHRLSISPSEYWNSQ